jgi:hypothetical protein
MLDPCIFGGIFKGCVLSYELFWAAVSAIASFTTAVIAGMTAYFLRQQLNALVSDSELKSAESYVNLMKTLQNGEDSGLITQVAAVRAIKRMRHVKSDDIVKDLSAIFAHLQQNPDLQKPKYQALKDELFLAIEHLKSNI